LPKVYLARTDIPINLFPPKGFPLRYEEIEVAEGAILGSILTPEEIANLEDRKLICTEVVKDRGCTSYGWEDKLYEDVKILLMPPTILEEFSYEERQNYLVDFIWNSASDRIGRLSMNFLRSFGRLRWLRESDKFPILASCGSVIFVHFLQLKEFNLAKFKEIYFAKKAESAERCGFVIVVIDSGDYAGSVCYHANQQCPPGISVVQFTGKRCRSWEAYALEEAVIKTAKNI
jgi:hypothetical protein